MRSSCDICIHKEVCKYKEEVSKQADQLEKKVDLPLELLCKYYKSEQDSIFPSYPGVPSYPDYPTPTTPLNPYPGYPNYPFSPVIWTSSSYELDYKHKDSTTGS